ncbi:hypothetical protein [Bradyrhizobium sp. McL0616]|uniref:hypothetical protein n=1 Tax=Bradyrhizobium sp. McL0616 TaxID=3415674 RepID=UPI003CF0CA22
MDYRKELEALMAETAALASRTAASGIKPPAPLPPTPIDIVAILNEPSRVPQRLLNLGPPEREQISKRVENFRGHQERFRREREDYFSRTMQRVHESMKGGKPPDD